MKAIAPFGFIDQDINLGFVNYIKKKFAIMIIYNRGIC